MEIPTHDELGQRITEDIGQLIELIEENRDGEYCIYSLKIEPRNTPDYTRKKAHETKRMAKYEKSVAPENAWQYSVGTHSKEKTTYIRGDQYKYPLWVEYAIQSDVAYYVGQTTDPLRRLAEHFYWNSDSAKPTTLRLFDAVSVADLSWYDGDNPRDAERRTARKLNRAESSKRGKVPKEYDVESYARWG